MLEFLQDLDPIWLSLGPLLALNGLVLSTFLVFYLGYSKWRRNEDVDRKELRFLPKFLIEYWYWLCAPIERTLVRLKISPDTLTLTGLWVSCAAAYFFQRGMVGAGGWLMILGATFDLLDGRVARLTHRETRSGAYFDSVIDRFAEGVIFLGLALWYRDSWVLSFVVVALIGSMMVSYTRARGEGEGVRVTKGIMQRPERILCLGLGSIFSPIFSYLVSFISPLPIDSLTILALVAIGVLTNLGAIYRIQYVLNELDPVPRDHRIFRKLVQRWVKR